MTLQHSQDAGYGLILASASVTRARLLHNAGVMVHIDPADLDEGALTQELRVSGKGPEDVACGLASAKAVTVSQRYPKARIVGADQIMVSSDRWIEKPATQEIARVMLLELRGRSHRLISAVAVATDEQVLWNHVSTATLRVRWFSEEFLDDYLHRVGSEVTEVVGACRLEGEGVQFFDHIDGDFFTILGLPLLPLLTYLRNEGVIMT